MKHRTAGDIADIWLRARLREERRMRTFAALRDGYPTPALWRALDRLHEATRLVNTLDHRLGGAIEIAADAAEWRSA